VRADTRTVQDSVLDDVVAGTQESTGRTPFPEVYHSFPNYLDVDSEGSHGTNSSGFEWLGDPFDFVESDVETVDLGEPESEHDLGSDEGMASSSSGICPLIDQEFAAFYADHRWGSDSLRLDADTTKFTGCVLGAKTPDTEYINTPIRLFSLYWHEAVLSKICEEMNRYAREVLPGGKGKKRRSRGGQTWKDVTPKELQTWLGILIIMGVKKLPSRRHYWRKSSEVLLCAVIPRVMSYKRSDGINRCLHLVNNATIVQGKDNPGFDKLAKSRWLIDEFVKTSKAIYNPEQVTTVDELIIPYKDKYCSCRQFMKDKPIRFGIKL
jgi:hypothetical protein